MKIFTTCDPKPIPVRNHDWEARVDEHPDEDSIIGYGSTRAAAIEDLIERLTMKTDKDYILEYHIVEDA